jgi:DNA-binding NarL/FixJ family response regulator
VLVVEDHEPFRQTLCRLLRRRTDVLIVGEAADGLDAVRHAEALRPDIVFLDVALPLLSGMEAATRIRALLPGVRLIFVTIESSFEILDQAVARGAHGYVFKPRAHRDVLTVLDAVVRGARFVNGGLERIAGGDGLASHRHHAVFCSSDLILIDAYSRFIASALHNGSAVIAVVAERHTDRLSRSLETANVDLVAAIREERYVPLQISELLARVMVNGSPDRERFLIAADEIVHAASKRAKGPNGRVVGVGEGTSAVWAQGHIEAAIQLEHLWDEVARERQMEVLCAFPMTAHQGNQQAFRSLCATHTSVEML